MRRVAAALCHLIDDIGLVPTFQKVHPTPIYELLGAIVITWILWVRGGPDKPKPIGQITGEYLILTGIARFLVEFIRINPRVLWGMTNAQLASLGAIGFGLALIAAVRARNAASAGKAADRTAAAHS